jgi:hypothetical protein
MYDDLINNLERLFQTKVALKIGRNMLIPSDAKTTEFQDFIGVELNELNRGVYLKEKILTPREKMLVRYLLSQYFDSNNTLNSLISKKYAYKDFDENIKFPLKIWEIKALSGGDDVLQVIKSIFPKDLCFLKSDDTVVLFRYKKNNSEYKLEDVYYNLESEILSEVSIYVSYDVEKIEDIFDAYQRLDNLKELSKTISSKCNIYEFDKLLLPNLFLTIKKYENFDEIKEIFNKSARYDLNDELIETAIVFLENNLHITESANKLYIHRNTMIYRLNKISSITGYDIRKFSGAINFYLNYLYDNLLNK